MAHGVAMWPVGFSGARPSRWRSCFARPPTPWAVEAGGFLEPDPRPRQSRLCHHHPSPWTCERSCSSPSGTPSLPWTWRRVARSPNPSSRWVRWPGRGTVGGLRGADALRPPRFLPRNCEVFRLISPCCRLHADFDYIRCLISLS